MLPANHDIGILLSGGGARAAYQAGALRAIAKILPRSETTPFRVICGTSAGAINAAMLAVHADSFHRGVARLLRLWRRIGVNDIYRADLATLARHAVRLLATLAGGPSAPTGAVSMLDNSPLAHLLASTLDMSRIGTHLNAGRLRAIGINATSYVSGHAVTFFMGAPDVVPWTRTRRHGQPGPLTIDHLMASSAIPFVFPAVRLADEFFMDGSVRQTAPLSPTFHLGARRILVLAVGQFNGQAPHHAPGPPRFPSFGQIAGHALSSVFLDNLGGDLERLQQINRLLNSMPAEHAPASRIDALVLGPSRDLGALALTFADRMPRGVRYLLRGFGSTRGTGANLLSYLLFDRDFCRALMRLGHDDAMARRDELAAFLSGSDPGYLPLFPPELR